MKKQFNTEGVPEKDPSIKVDEKQKEEEKERKSFWRDFWKPHKSDKKDYLGNIRDKPEEDDWW